MCSMSMKTATLISLLSLPFTELTIKWMPTWYMRSSQQCAGLSDGTPEFVVLCRQGANGNVHLVLALMSPSRVHAYVKRWNNMHWHTVLGKHTGISTYLIP